MDIQNEHAAMRQLLQEMRAQAIELVVWGMPPGMVIHPLWKRAKTILDNIEEREATARGGEG